jgi:HEAT repeat protein
MAKIKTDNASIRNMISNFKGADEKGFRKNIRKLTKLGHKAINPLIGALYDSSSRVRIGAVLTLSEINDKEVVRPLIGVLFDSSRDVRQAAIKALGRLGYVEAVPALMDIATNSVNLGVAKTLLEELGEPIHTNRLVTTPKESDTQILAIRALAKIGDPRAISALEKSLSDIDGEVRDQAARALLKMGWSPGKDKEAVYFFIVKGQLSRLSEMGDSVVGPLLEILGNWDNVSRLRSLKVLKRIQDPRSVSQVLEALEDQDPEIRSYAGEVLTSIGREAADVLVREIGTMSKEGRIHAMKVLTTMESDLAFASLVQALEDPDAKIRCAAADCLASLGTTSAVGPLSEAHKDKRLPVRWHAAKALAELGDATGIETLFQALAQPDPTVRNEAEKLLKKLGWRKEPDNLH